MKQKGTQSSPEPRAWQDVIAEGNGDPVLCLTLLKREFPSLNDELWKWYLGLLHKRGLLPQTKHPRTILWRCPRCGDKSENETPRCHPPSARVRVCKACETEVLYDRKHDAFYCRGCNVWLEEACKDPTCGYCAGRAAQPLPIASECGP